MPFSADTNDRSFIEIALESAHAVWGAVELAKTLPKGTDVVMVSSIEIELEKISLTFCSAYPDEETRMLNRYRNCYRENGRRYSTGTYDYGIQNLFSLGSTVHLLELYCIH